MSTPREALPHELWKRADAEFPADEVKRRERYFVLMIEAGHLTLVPEGNVPDPFLAEMAKRRRRAEAESGGEAMA